MPDAARVIDSSDTAPPFTAVDIARLEAKYAGMATGAMLGDLLTGVLRG